MAAMEALKPIENLFAIFRDKLFDERLAMLSDELEILSHPDPDHPTFLAMRRALDIRRDDKIALEQVSLQYKLGVLERVTMASQAQLHSQFYQGIRQQRETHMSVLNEHFSKIQRDRRQMKSNEPQYGMRFSTRRSEQVAHQQSYNKEVSLLSGIARHVGFPAAPEIRIPTQMEVDDDLRAMKVCANLALHLLMISKLTTPCLQIRAPKPQYVPHPLPGAPRIHQDEGPTDEAWYERNAWANPNHPAHQQARFIDRQVLANNTPYATPATQRRALDPRQTMPGSGSTLELGSEHPSSALGPGSNRLPNGQTEAHIYDKSSPFEQMKRRNIETHRPDGTPRAQYAQLSNGTKQAYESNMAAPFDALGLQHAQSAPAPPREADLVGQRPYAPRLDMLEAGSESERQRSLGYSGAPSAAPPAPNSAGLGVR